MPCLPIPKLAAPVPLSFKSVLLAASPSKVISIDPLRRLYDRIEAEWANAEYGEALYRSTEPKLRELLIGVRDSVPFGREIEYAFQDFGTAAQYAKRNDWQRACMYLGYALIKLFELLSTKRKLGYGYDISGEQGERGGTSGNDRHLWDTGNAPKHDHTTSNPANMLYDAEAESDYPQLREFKHKRVYWPPRTR